MLLAVVGLNRVDGDVAAGSASRMLDMTCCICVTPAGLDAFSRIDVIVYARRLKADFKTCTNTFLRN